ncbi:phosphoesterase, MJ0936 family [Gracilibacillus ureilyticus]|uniref:Phosphoesterase n=1 Tax=Gracilibacillus ureilyticus TaxID=531814 RepID=A0A1H9PJY7_9BACI|nr:metallophosphoesterase family protein [Gracilibacillus ureilyticus]SER48484.1 phosphoesterase, MJ0936 family [Gracilibacillus ureilyticus]
MKLAFISDIHGNSVALEAVLEDIKSRLIDDIVVLGDLCYRGPEPKQSLDLIRSLHAKVLKGNADEWVIRGVNEGEVPDSALSLMNKEQAWTREKLDDNDIVYLEQLPSEFSLTYENINIHAYHATPDSLFNIVLPEQSDEELLNKLTLSRKADIYLYGHIHTAYKRVIDGKTIINTGSVGLPFDGINHASYVIIELKNGSLSTNHIRVPYDIEKVCKQYEDNRYPNKEMMQQIIRTGRNQ